MRRNRLFELIFSPFIIIYVQIIVSFANIGMRRRPDVLRGSTHCLYSDDVAKPDEANHIHPHHGAQFQHILLRRDLRGRGGELLDGRGLPLRNMFQYRGAMLQHQRREMPQSRSHGRAHSRRHRADDRSHLFLADPGDCLTINVL